MNDFTKEDKNNVILIFDSKKDEGINFSWAHYCRHPEMKKYLVNERNDNGYSLRDTRTNQIILSASFSLKGYLK